MPETPTVRENILLNLKSVLEGITVVNHYNNTIANVQRWNQRGQITSSVPYITIAAGPEDKKPEPNPFMTCTLSVYIDVWTNHLETDTRSSDEILNSLLGDVQKALMADHTRGGYAITTNILRVIPCESIEGQPQIGIWIDIEIIYQHQQSDPAVGG